MSSDEPGHVASFHTHTHTLLSLSPLSLSLSLSQKIPENEEQDCLATNPVTWCRLSEGESTPPGAYLGALSAQQVFTFIFYFM